MLEVGNWSAQGGLDAKVCSFRDVFLLFSNTGGDLSRDCSHFRPPYVYGWAPYPGAQKSTYLGSWVLLTLTIRSCLASI